MKNFKSVVPAIAVFATIAIGMVFSAPTKAADGVIHFRGEIVEPACSIKTVNSETSVLCQRSGKVTESLNLNVADLDDVQTDTLRIRKQQVGDNMFIIEATHA